MAAFSYYTKTLDKFKGLEYTLISGVIAFGLTPNPHICGDSGIFHLEVFAMTTERVVTGEQEVSPTPEEIEQYWGMETEARTRFKQGRVRPEIWRKAFQQIIDCRAIELSLAQRQAQAELGQDFITPEEAARYLGYTLTSEDLATLSELKLQSGRILTLEDIRREKGKRVLHPVLPVSILEMRKRFGIDLQKQPCFWKDQDKNLDLTKAEFASFLPKKPYWDFIAKEAKEGSFSTTWHNQEKLLSPGERRTATLEVCQAAFQYFQKTGIRLYQDFYAWCSDALGESRVHAGSFREDGFYFYYFLPASSWHFYGLVSSLE